MPDSGCSTRRKRRDRLSWLTAHRGAPDSVGTAVCTEQRDQPTAVTIQAVTQNGTSGGLANGKRARRRGLGARREPAYRAGAASGNVYGSSTTPWGDGTGGSGLPATAPAYDHDAGWWRSSHGHSAMPFSESEINLEHHAQNVPQIDGGRRIWPQRRTAHPVRSRPASTPAVGRLGPRREPLIWGRLRACVSL